MGEVRRLVRLAWPVVLGQIGLVAMGAIDLFMIGPLGRDATAALGLGNTWSVGLFIGALGVATGIDPLVTQAYGAGDPRRAGVAAARGLLLIGLLCVPIMAGHLLTGPVLTAMGQPAAVVPDAATYCAIISISMPPLLALLVMRQLLQADGLMRPGMWVVLVGNLVNVAGNALLIGPFGVAGVAWSTVIVRWVMLLGLIALGWRPFLRAWPAEPILRAAPMWALAAVSLPVGLQVGLEIWAFNLASFVAGWVGETALAAHVASINAVSLSFMAASGIAAAAATRVGNLVGAGQDWRRSATVSLGMVAVVMSLSGLIFLSFPHAVGRAYNADPAVIAAVASVLPIGALFGLFDGGQVVAFGILRGLGDTRLPSVFNVVGYWVIGLPLAAALAIPLGWGLQGIWIGIATSLILVFGMLALRIRWHARR